MEIKPPAIPNSFEALELLPQSVLVELVLQQATRCLNNSSLRWNASKVCGRKTAKPHQSPHQVT
ncbi:hypothetical protein [Moorena producens]|uniref:hypothetical protein n=1 Tax=Moorena producens TaxID=1155739 RepID=UPI003C71EB18